MHSEDTRRVATHYFRAKLSKQAARGEAPFRQKPLLRLFSSIFRDNEIYVLCLRAYVNFCGHTLACYRWVGQWCLLLVA